ncbi:12-oxophytodienoate reductase 1 [Hypsibius exemplaris]|uniref:12-oxophytodienoate reductase 1 n=1 Tax=Hypsibius exemplaris TaxID=2072580 RepID=A0A1W0XDY8_HYPEX|nr:12-oxophytodienoate reductase 1 [Hypsibius exemplaris]
MGHFDKEKSAQSEMSALFTPLKIGNLNLSHRIVLAPLTRMRASPAPDERVPNVELASEYYSQRATKGGLLIAEATSISQQALGYPRTPGIWTDKQTAAWKEIVRPVKQKGAFFFLQLWHVGRVSHSSYQPDGQAPVAPSAVAIPDELTPLADGSRVPFEVPRALRAEEIPAIVEDYRKAAKNAFLAGFDGVEVHAANGYLIDQFLHDGSNKRTDNYGGSIENRSRFLFEVLEGVQAAWAEAVGPSSPLARNVGIRLGPFGTFNNMSDSNETELFRYVFTKLNATSKPAYIHIIEPRVTGTTTNDETADADVLKSLGKLFSGPIISAGGYHPETAHSTVQRSTQSDPPQEVAVAFGRTFIANPDFPLRVLLKAPLNPYNRATFYSGEAVGYTDQPFLTEDVVKSHTEALQLQFQDNQEAQRHLQSYSQLLKL